MSESSAKSNRFKSWVPSLKATRLRVYRLATRLNIPLADAAKVELEQYDHDNLESWTALQRLPRSLYFNLALPESELDDTGEAKRFFPRNKIRTAKYTPLNFLPKNVFLQFQNVANLFFLFLVILQCIKLFGNQVNPGLAAVPLIVVVGITAIKDAIEDFRRTMLDIHLNNTPTLRLSNYNNPNIRTEYVSYIRKFKKRMSALFRVFLMKKNRKKEENTVSDSVPLEDLSSERRPSYDSVFRGSIDMGDPFDESKGKGDYSLSDGKTAVHQQRAMDVIDYQAVGSGDCQFKKVFWKDIRVGDFVKVSDNEEIPADIVILNTSDPEGICYIETKNLDGETNLKIRHALTAGKNVVDEMSCERSRFWIESEPPNANLYEYNGACKCYGHTDTGMLDESQLHSEPVSLDNLLLRGCAVRNTKWVIGVVVFTGDDTKIMLNSGAPPLKRSRITRNLNWNVYLNFIILFAMCLVCGIVEGIAWRGKTRSSYYFEWGSIGGSAAKNGIVTFFTGVVLFQNLVPISLYISIEIVKTIQAIFIYFDKDMYYKKLNYPCTPKSWNISDDLGQVEYIFSDKTGTLTQNVMEFKKCSINGVPYGEAFTEAMAGIARREGKDSEQLTVEKRSFIDRDRMQMIAQMRNTSDNKYLVDENLTFVSSQFVHDLTGKAGEEQSMACYEFFLALALCHSVVADRVGDRIVYKAQSPDEAALVGTARDVGFVFLDQRRDIMVTRALGETHRFKLLDTIDFTSARKRMSVVIRGPDNRYVLICKGADSVIYDRLEPGEQPTLQKVTAEQLKTFALEGLRTLCIAKRELTEEYFEWKEKYTVASSAIENREERISEVADLIESRLTLLGGTAIEDRLQEGVPDAIALLGSAGIKLWVLTGDKMETAINIGFSCNLLDASMELIKFDVDQEISTPELEVILADYLYRYFGLSGSNEELEAAKQDHDVPAGSHALIIDGGVLKRVLEGSMRTKFLLLCKQCKSVLCCRVSPAQKAEVVHLVRDSLDVMTLAIGDGANDVAMIQKADIGIGIVGEEGRAAAMSADYAIAQFRFLSKLVLVHGRWDYNRIAEMVNNFFYKSVVWTFTLFWFQIYNNFDANYLFDYTYIMLFNLIFSSLPVIVMGVYDQDVSAEVSLKIPQLYKRGILQLNSTPQIFIGYMIDGFYQSVICFFFSFLVINNVTVAAQNGRDTMGMQDLGVYVAAPTIMVVDSYVLLNQANWDVFSVGIWALSCITFWFWTGVYSQSYYSVDLYKSASRIFRTPNFWAVLFGTIVSCLFPKFLFMTVQKLFWPYDTDIIREGYRTRRLQEFDEEAVIESPEASTDWASSTLQVPFNTSTSSFATMQKKDKDHVRMDTHSLSLTPSIPNTFGRSYSPSFMDGSPVFSDEVLNRPPEFLPTRGSVSSSEQPLRPR
ncbi:plasma membrane phospholipid-translocating ATPase complex, ATPase subunit Dnf2 [Schizosaccharomyces osmophilus]|uniref:Phospholipid-transporting ATPase n=1 Tax=Schizosaccharomyces osmophilus TaxID=2545709 RepID=A0AAE9WD36_9SCHI|nr:plasma membrane phospholipid-translocating ATPase complex, ATPase subunit Dnf2 [Schizosaccharomyces osmophilus]WBW74039.1 plasma membrane phospholipid-translocating ATPase complex, ATPase subunit Dnf2 [Schizosaccharomyces osmophilus]